MFQNVFIDSYSNPAIRILLREIARGVEFGSRFLPQAGFDNWPLEGMDGDYLHPYCSTAEDDWKSIMSNTLYYPLTVAPIFITPEGNSITLPIQQALFKLINYSSGIIRYEDGFAVLSMPFFTSSDGKQITWKFNKASTVCRYDLFREFSAIPTPKYAYMIRKLCDLPSKYIQEIFERNSLVEV